MLFEQRLADGIADGSITVAFRRWKRRQVVPGGRYRSPAGIVEMRAVDIVDEADISEEDAARAGYPSVAKLRAGLRGPEDLPLYRLELRRVDEPDPRAVLAAEDGLSSDDIAEVDRRLDRLDRASPRGPWTAQALAAIASRPGVRAPDLAAAAGRDTQSFKRDVRKLKELGLTLSLEIGYRLSPRGQAYWRGTARRS